MEVIGEESRGLPGLEQISIAEATHQLRERWGALAAGLTPLEHLGNGYLACTFIGAGCAQPSRVVLWHAFLPLHEQPFITLGTDTENYWHNRKSETEIIAAALLSANAHQTFGAEWQTASLDVFRHTVEEFHANPDAHSHKKRGTLPRYDSWKPVRHCVHDFVLGLAGYRHDRKQNLLQVNSFITSDHADFESGAGTRALLELLLCEAFRAGGPLALEFLSPNAGSSPNNIAIPPDVRVFAALANVDLPVDTKHIDPNAARALFLFLSGLERVGQDALLRLDAVGKASIEQICYLIISGVWSAADLTSLLLWCPILQLLSSADVELHHRGALGILLGHTRAVLLSAWAQAKTEALIEMSSGSMDVRSLTPQECNVPHGRLISSSDTLEVVCEAGSLLFAKEEPMMVIPLGLPSVYLVPAMKEAIQAMQSERKKALMVLPADFRLLSGSDQNRIIDLVASRPDVRVMICEHDILTLDLDTISRITKARVLRQ